MSPNNTTTLSREQESQQSEPKTREQQCPECAGAIISDEKHGESHCRACGLVIDEEEIDHGPEWRSFSQEQKDQRSRVGAPQTKMHHDGELTTAISWQDQDAAGRVLPGQKRAQMHRLRRWQQRIRTANAGERNLELAFSEINRMASSMGIPKSTREVASMIYRQALEGDLLRGRSIEGMSSAALYAACREEQFPRSLDEVTTVSRVDRNEIGRAYRYLSAELGLTIEPTDPKQYLPRFCSELDLGSKLQQKAAEIINVAAKEGLLSGRSPPGCAGAAIYSATRVYNRELTQVEIAEVADVTEVTIRNRYQEQLQALGAIQPKNQN